jgi:hypothetical protein
MMAKVKHLENWGRSKARERYADGGDIPKISLPPKPSDYTSRIVSARTSGSKEVADREIKAARDILLGGGDK